VCFHVNAVITLETLARVTLLLPVINTKVYNLLLAALRQVRPLACMCRFEPGMYVSFGRYTLFIRGSQWLTVAPLLCIIQYFLQTDGSVFAHFLLVSCLAYSSTLKFWGYFPQARSLTFIELRGVISQETEFFTCRGV
jgi:hypothetical protein